MKHDFKDGNGPVPAHQHPNGNGWVADTAKVAASAYVGPDARVFGNATVRGNATVGGNAQVFGNAWVYGNAEVYGTAWVYGTACVGWNECVHGYACVWGDATLEGEDKCEQPEGGYQPPPITGTPVPNPDPTNPDHYKGDGPEVIAVTRHLNFDRGNAVKYICRAGKKDPSKEVEDLKKARWYIDDELQRLTGEGDHAK